MISPVRMTGSGKTPQDQPAATTKKQTQPNPLQLSILCSDRYITLEQTKPNGVKTFVSYRLRQKKPLFSTNMDGTQRHYSRIGEKSQRACGRWRANGITFKAGMLLIIGNIHYADTRTIPYWERPVCSVRLALNLLGARPVETSGRRYFRIRSRSLVYQVC